MRQIKGAITRRVARNVGWLAGSRAFSGVVSLAYLAIAARSLGRVNFGIFALILTYGQMIANLVQFQSWKGVIRYGAVHAAARDRLRLARLFGFSATLDAISAIAGLVIAIISVPFVAPLLHFNVQEQRLAGLFAGALLLTTGATASGMLRLFDRFDLIAYCEALAPAVRLVGSALAWSVHAGVRTFLLVWLAASASQLIAQWAFALNVHGSPIAVGRKAFVAAVRENRRILRFMFQTNLSNSLGLFWMQLGTLTVGATAGPVQAGGFRISQRLSKAIAKPVEPFTRALYPELAHLVAQDEHAALRKILVRGSLIAAALAAVIVLGIALWSSKILELVAGDQFKFAHRIFLLLAVAAGIDLASFALEPFHNAHGRSGRVLRSRVIAVVIYLVLLVSFSSRGAEGAALAGIGAALAIVAQLGFSAFQILRAAGPHSHR